MYIAPVGAGKSRLWRKNCEELRRLGKKVYSVDLREYYLTHNETEMTIEQLKEETTKKSALRFSY